MYLCIGGFYFKITWRRVKFVNLVKSIIKAHIQHDYQGFVVKQKLKTWDFEIVFTDNNTLEVFSHPQNIDYVYSAFYHRNNHIIETHYLISIFHFHILIRKLLLELLAKSGGFILHASSSKKDQRQALIFLGESGAGKSTIMNLLKDDFTPLGDDTLIINKTQGRYYAYATPFIERASWIQKNNNQYDISGIYVLKKSLRHSIEAVSFENQIPLFVAQLITTTEFKNNHVENILGFLNTKPTIQQLSFTKDLRKKDELVQLLRVE